MGRQHLMSWVVALLSLVSSVAMGAEARAAPQPSWRSIAHECGVAPTLLLAVSLMESGKRDNQTVSPWPYAFNTAGQSHFAPTHAAAVTYLRQAMRRYHPNRIDVGLMQINLRWHGDKVSSAEALLDPVTNLRIGCDVLKAALASAPGDPELGIGRYHHWRDERRSRRYGRRVQGIWSNLIRYDP